jgi:hypothetical protein
VEKLSEMLPYEIFVAKGRSEDQDERVAAGSIRIKPRTRENSEEVPNTQLMTEAGFKIDECDVVILNRKGKPIKQDIMQSLKLSRNLEQDSRNAVTVGRGHPKKSLSIKRTITLLEPEDPTVPGGVVFEQCQIDQSNDFSYEFPSLSDCFDVAGKYELAFTMQGSDVYDDKGQLKTINWKQTIVVAPNAPKHVEVNMEGDADAAVLPLGCEKAKWIECRFRDAFGSEPNASGAAAKRKGKGKGKGGGSAESKGKEVCGEDEDSVALIGNLCPVPRKLELKFEDIKPIGLQLSAHLCDDVKDGKAAWNVKIEPTSKDCPALARLRKKAGSHEDCQCTLVFTYKESKKKRGQDDTDYRTIKRDKFKFKIEAGDPYELRAGGGNKAYTDKQLARREDALVIDNRGKLPQVSIQVVDRWGCLVARYKGNALKVSEELVYIGDDAQIKARREVKDTLKRILREVHETKGGACIGDRVICLQDPPVSKPEDHELQCKLVNHKGEMLECTSVTRARLTVSVTVKPSTCPQEAIVWVGNRAVKHTNLENPVPTTAGGKQANVKIEFLDEAKRRVSLSKDDGWTVSGGGWGKKEVPCVCECDFLKMPPGLVSRTKVGDASEHTIIFQGPPSDTGLRSTMKVNINLVPVAAKPRQWVVVEAPSATSAAPTMSTSKAEPVLGDGAAVQTGSSVTRCEASKPVHIRSGQPLCEVMCLALVDEYGNFVALEDYHLKVQPEVMRIGGGEKVEKGGEWKEQSYAYNPARNCLMFQAGIHLKGLSGHDKMELRVTTNTAKSQPECKDIKACMQTIQIVAGEPHRVRLSMAGFPFDTMRTSGDTEAPAGDANSSKFKTLSTEVQVGQRFSEWPSLTQIEDLCVEIVDEAGNIINAKHNSELTIKLALRGGKLCVSGKSSPAGGSEQLDPIKLELKRSVDWFKKLKKVYIYGEPGSTAVLEASASISGYEIRKAEASISFVAHNIVQRIELHAQEVPENARAGQCVSLRARVHMQDGGKYEALLVDALKCVLSRPHGLQAIDGLPGALVDICVHSLERSKCSHCRMDICEHNLERSQCDICLDPDPDHWVQWQVSGDDVDRMGMYVFTVSFTDTRPQMKAMLEGLGLPKVSNQESRFNVLPGTAWHLKIQRCVTASNNLSMPTVSNIRDQDATNVVVQNIEVQLQDCHGNVIRAPPGSMKIAAFLVHPDPAVYNQRRMKGTREVCAEVDFLFINNAQRREEIRKENETLENYQREYSDLMEQKKRYDNNVEKFRRACEDAKNSLQQAVAVCVRLKALPQDLTPKDITDSQSEREIEGRLRTFADRLTMSRDTARRLQVSRSLEYMVADIQNEFPAQQPGEERVLGVLGQLIIVKDDTVAHLLSAFKSDLLKLLICKDSATQVAVCQYCNRKSWDIQQLSMDQVHSNARTQHLVFKNPDTGEEMVRFPGHNAHRFPNISEQMLINHIQFRNPAHQHLRFTVLHSLLHQTMILDQDLRELMNYRKMMISHNLKPPELWSAKDMQKVSGTGISGGFKGKAKPLEELRRAIETRQSNASILLPGPDEAQPKIAALKEAAEKRIALENKKTHYLTFMGPQLNMHTKNDKRIADLVECIQKSQNKIWMLKKSTRCDNGDGGEPERAPERPPPQLSSSNLLDPGHVLRTQYGALGNVLLVDVKEQGGASFSDVRLDLNAGSLEGHFVLCFVVVDAKDLTPLEREGAEGDAHVLVTPDFWPK